MGLRDKLEKVKLNNKEIELNRNVAVFVTMNPVGSGYSGRAQLPGNLRELFRPVSMAKPDITQIIKVKLIANGFREGEDLGNKITSLFKNCKELIGEKNHYDWGLRSITTIIEYATTNYLFIKREVNSDLNYL